MASIEKEFEDRGVVRGGELMLRPCDAMVFVAKCRERGVEVLGVDGFRLTEHTIQPVMEQSVDLSQPQKAENLKNCWDRAEDFLRPRASSDLFFKVVIDEQ